MRKQSRYSLKYRIKMWWYRLTKEDVYKGIWFVIDCAGMLLMGIGLFVMVFILPAFFY